MDSIINTTTRHHNKRCNNKHHWFFLDDWRTIHECLNLMRHHDYRTGSLTGTTRSTERDTRTVLRVATPSVRSIIVKSYCISQNEGERAISIPIRLTHNLFSLVSLFFFLSLRCFLSFLSFRFFYFLLFVSFFSLLAFPHAIS